MGVENECRKPQDGLKMLYFPRRRSGEYAAWPVPAGDERVLAIFGNDSILRILLVNRTDPAPIMKYAATFVLPFNHTASYVAQVKWKPGVGVSDSAKGRTGASL